MFKTSSASSRTTLNLGDPSGFLPTSFCTGTPTLEFLNPVPVLEDKVLPAFNLAFKSAWSLFAGGAVLGSSGSKVGSILPLEGAVAGVAVLVPAGGTSGWAPVSLRAVGLAKLSSSLNPWVPRNLIRLSYVDGSPPPTNFMKSLFKLATIRSECSVPLRCDWLAL